MRSGEVIGQLYEYHECNPPEPARNVSPGTVWCCDGCGNVLVRKKPGEEGAYDPAWRRPKRRERKRIAEMLRTEGASA